MTGSFMSSRRQFITTTTSVIVTTLAVGSEVLNPKNVYAHPGHDPAEHTNNSQTNDPGKIEGRFVVPKLPYSFDAFEPVINTETMQLHYTKHHDAYVTKLNAALEKTPQLKGQNIVQLLTSLRSIPENVREAIRNHGGGHYNHSLFWNWMTPKKEKPSEKMLKLFESTFGGFEEFKVQFEEKGAALFGSGWVWLVKDKKGKLSIQTTQNQDNPITEGYTVLLGNDVWEHAYYLTYRNRRADYLKAWWEVVNWPIVEAVI
jgi:superoxide dismutase, Fe-Mn family